MTFFLAGYPKSGTTYLYDYLKNNPAVFLPSVKEPHYFTEDYPGAREVTSESDYLALYPASVGEQLCGDASASVIHSAVAVDRILARYPQAKFIVLVREPVAAVRSFHGELLNNLNEDVEDFQWAWRLQEARSEGREIPGTCKEPRLLQYSEMFRYREQLPTFFKKVPAEQRLVLIFEDFFADPQAGCLQVLDFLGLYDDCPVEFGAVNSARRHRFRCLAEAHHRLVSGNGPVYRGAKALLSTLRIHPSHLLARLNHKPGGGPPIDKAFEAELREHFRVDVETVEQLLGREVEDWRR